MKMLMIHQVQELDHGHQPEDAGSGSGSGSGAGAAGSDGAASDGKSSA